MKNFQSKTKLELGSIEESFSCEEDSLRKKEDSDFRDNDMSNNSPLKKPDCSSNSPLKIKIKIGAKNSSEMVSEVVNVVKKAKGDTNYLIDVDEKEYQKGIEVDNDVTISTMESEEFHGFDDSEIPMFVCNNFETVDLNSTIQLNPTMFVSISSRKAGTGEVKKKLLPVEKVNPQIAESQTFLRTPKVRFSDEVNYSDVPSRVTPPESHTPIIGTPLTETMSTPALAGASKKNKFWEPLYDGWMRELVVRENKLDSTKTRKEVYYHCPETKGKPRLKFRSANELEGHLITSGSMYPLTFFTFKKAPVGAPEPFEVIRDSNTKSPVKQAVVPEDTINHLEKRVSKKTERLINEKEKERNDKNLKRSKVATKEYSENGANGKNSKVDFNVQMKDFSPEVRISKRTIKPKEIFDPYDVDTSKRLKAEKTVKYDSYGLWKDPDNIMSPKKSVTLGTGKSGTGLLKVKMFSKLNAKNISNEDKLNESKDDDVLDVSFEDPVIDPLATTEIDLLTSQESIAVSDDEDVIIEDPLNVKPRHLPVQLAPAPPISETFAPRVVSISSLQHSLPPTVTIQRTGHLPSSVSSNQNPSISHSPMYPNMQAGPIEDSTSRQQIVAIGSNMPQNYTQKQRILYPTKKTLLPCSIHCPGTTGFPSLSCKSCHCLFHPKCVGVPSNQAAHPNAAFYCNDCKHQIPVSLTTPQEPTLTISTRTNHPTQPVRVKVKKPVAQKPIGAKRLKPQPVPTAYAPPTSITSRPATQSMLTSFAKPNTGPPPLRPIENQTMVNIGGKKFLVIPRDDITLESPPPSPPLHDDTSSSGSRKLPVLLQSTDQTRSMPDFEVEQMNDGRLVIKPIGDVDPVEIFGSSNLKRAASNEPEKGPAKKKRMDFNNLHKTVTEGYFAQMNVFKYLSVHDRLKAGLVCKLWNDLANHYSLWESITLKNLKITDWDTFSKYMRRVSCQSIDMRKMVFVKDRDATWTDILANITKIPTLKRLQLPRISGSVLVSILQDLHSIEVLNSPLTVSPLDTTIFKKFTGLKELRLKTGSGLLNLEKGLHFLECLSPTLTNLSLLTVTGLTEADYDCIGTLNNLEQVELGDCTDAPVTLFKTLSDLSNLTRIRLEKGTVTDNIAKLQRSDNLRYLEMIDFHVRPGFKEGLKGMNNVRKLLIIPTYKDEVASSNTQILEGVTTHLKHLECFYLGVTNEWLHAMSMVIGESQRTKSPGERECFPIEKEGKVEYISLPGLYRKVCRDLPSTKVKVLKMSAGATCKQFIRSLDK